ncbi:DUF5069 domain-containing protein [Escherichia coli]|uniref:DUF5069 domain-containing protein n=1 Tax=Escherichia coli TaxID=562 RepID=UPI001F0E68FC|nr:DUF5069 domain-containing protein [Escherichia coli]
MRKYGVYPTFHNHVSHKDAFFNDVIQGGKWCPSDEELNEQLQSVRTLSKAQIEQEIVRWNKEIYFARMHRLKLWLSAVFGLHLGPERDKGGFNYERSAPLYSVDGGYEHLGMVFWAGITTRFTFKSVGRAALTFLTVRHREKYITGLIILMSRF